MELIDKLDKSEFLQKIRQIEFFAENEIFFAGSDFGKFFVKKMTKNWEKPIQKKWRRRK